MPIWLRKFTIKKITDYHNKQQEEINKAYGKSNTTNFINNDGTINNEAYKTYKTEEKRKLDYQSNLKGTNVNG